MEQLRLVVITPFTGAVQKQHQRIAFLTLSLIPGWLEKPTRQLLSLGRFRHEYLIQ
jgi:hypothetical protein